jgi:hypothetical protein
MLKRTTMTIHCVSGRFAWQDQRLLQLPLCITHISLPIRSHRAPHLVSCVLPVTETDEYRNL